MIKKASGVDDNWTHSASKGFPIKEGHRTSQERIAKSPSKKDLMTESIGRTTTPNRYPINKPQ